MSESFLSHFLHFVQRITNAERCMAINSDLVVVETCNMNDDILETAEFNALASISVSQAIQNGELVITNTTNSESLFASKTNGTEEDLRIVIVIPIVGQGAIYIDQAIETEIIPKETIDRLASLATQIATNTQFDLTQDEIREMYYELVEK